MSGWLLVLVSLARSSWAIQFYEDFSSGSAGWLPDHASWTILKTAPETFVYRGDFTGDTLTQNRNISLGGSWRIEANFQFQRYLDGGTRGIGALALFPRVGSGVQLLAIVNRLSSGYVLFEVFWFNAARQNWTNVLSSGWSGSSPSYSVQLTRLAGSNKLTLHVFSANGFTYEGETQPMPDGLLDTLPIVGFRVDGAMVDYSRLLVTTPLNLSPPSIVPQVVYRTEFTSGAGTEWSPRNTSVTPIAGRRFLGEFGGNQTATLSLTNLPRHSEITVLLELFIIRTWEGVGDSDNGPDTWRLSVRGGPSLVRATFLNSFFLNKNSAQSYPDTAGSNLHDGRTAAVENNSLGYSWNGRPLDSVYRLAFTFLHEASDLKLDFASSGLQALGDESWGLDNVVIYAGPTLPIITYAPQNQYLPVGDTATLSVRAAGGADLKHQWYREGSKLNNETNSTLTIAGVQASHAGTYTVRVSNDIGFVESTQAALGVFASRPQQQWEFSTSGGIGGSPAIGKDGTVYVGSIDRSIYGIDPSGVKKWSLRTGGAIVDSPSIGVSDQVYVGSRDARLLAVRADGTAAWSKTAGGSESSPALADDETIYVGSPSGTIFAYAPGGSNKWSRATGGWVASSPAVGTNGTIYIGSQDGRVYAKTVTGTALWSFQTSGAVDSSPAIGVDGTIYVGASDRRLYALAPNGTGKWVFPTDGPIESSPAIGLDGTIYVGSGDKHLYAVSPHDGTMKWAFATDVPIASSPAIAADGTIFFGPISGRIYALNSDGSVKWVFAVGIGVFGSSPMLTPDGNLYVSGGGKVYALNSGSGLAKSAWPMFRHDPRHTANANSRFVIPALLAPEWMDNEDFAFALHGEIGQTYQIDVSIDLTKWDSFTNFVATMSRTTISHHQGSGDQRRFYRVVTPR